MKSNVTYAGNSLVECASKKLEERVKEYQASFDKIYFCASKKRLSSDEERDLMNILNCSLKYQGFDPDKEEWAYELGMQEILNLKEQKKLNKKGLEIFGCDLNHGEKLSKYKIRFL